jgi:ABC-2 type transport system permease protein
MWVETLRSPIRASAFVGKEIYEILRQPRLMLTVALGPFLIMLLFGVGYRNEPPIYNTLFVAPATPELQQRIQDFSAGTQLQIAGITQDETEARARLRAGDVDLVIVVPPDPEGVIRSNQQAVFTLYHNEIDPLDVGYIEFLGQIYSDTVNRQVLRELVTQGQAEAADAREDVAAARETASAMRQALERGDSAAARQEQQNLDQQVTGLELALGASLAVLDQANQVSGAEPQAGGAAELREQLASLRQTNQGLAIVDDRPNYTAEAEQVAEIEAELEELEANLNEFINISPEVLVSPFRSETQTVAPAQPRMIDFYTPGVLSLLLQHIAVAFGALSIVRDRQLGTLELFRVSPVRAVEVLLGKYFSFMLFGGLVALGLTLLAQLALSVPLAGNPWDYALVIATLLFTSLGFGFVISLLAQTDSQAVQAAMILLLASVFFSGFFIALYLLWEPVRLISWALPVTYGMALLQQVMLLGTRPDPILLGSLAGLGLILAVLAWLLMRRLLARR